jgi:hypothetical protein
MLAHKGYEVEAMYRIGVDEFTLANIFGRFGFFWLRRGLRGPVEAAVK